MKKRGFISIKKSAASDRVSVIELNILPGERTPWHFHSLFSETFEILEGTLEVGKGNRIHQLKQGETATVERNEKHYYHNVSSEECIIRATVNQGNTNFEIALLILKGLANDGLATSAGTPRKLSDLVLFVYLSNSEMIGLQKIAEPIFKFLATRAIRKGRLENLILSYANGSD